MKARTGFVSNSSSSSFVVIDSSCGYESLNIDGGHAILGPEKGEHEFGWGPERIDDIWSRINFAFLQAHYAIPEHDALLEKARTIVYGHSNSYLQMLEEVLMENSNINTITWDFTRDEFGFEEGYIDHQSNASEGQNMEIFNSKDTLKDFIFGKNSYIQLDNDNH